MSDYVTHTKWHDLKPIDVAKLIKQRDMLKTALQMISESTQLNSELEAVVRTALEMCPDLTIIDL